MTSTYATLINTKHIVPSSTSGYYAVEKHFLMGNLVPYISKIYFDEAWYLSKHPDISVAIKSGAVANAHDHFVRFGYWEHRMPYPIQVDEGWYRKTYADVQQAIARKAFPSGQAHYEREGYREGRMPYPNFELRMHGEAPGRAFG
jgi:hypothetical protein